MTRTGSLRMIPNSVCKLLVPARTGKGQVEAHHGLYDGKQGWNGLCLLSNLGLVDGQLDAVVLEVIFHLLAVDIVDVDVGYSKTPLPLFVQVGKIGILDVENAIDEGEIIFNLLVSFNVESSVTGGGRCLLDSGFEV